MLELLDLDAKLLLMLFEPMLFVCFDENFIVPWPPPDVDVEFNCELRFTIRRVSL